jgi:hypothetical protein
MYLPTFVEVTYSSSVTEFEFEWGGRFQAHKHFVTFLVCPVSPNITYRQHRD